MDAPKDGGRAFPILHTIDGNWVKEPLDEYSGMTLRDYFAAQAVTGLLAHPDCQPVGKGHEVTTACVAAEAYAVADTLLKARSS